VPGFHDELAKRLLEAEKIDKWNRPEQRKKKYRITRCPVGHKIEYSLRVGHTGELKIKCHCGLIFIVPSMDGFLKNDG